MYFRENNSGKLKDIKVNIQLDKDSRMIPWNKLKVLVIDYQIFYGLDSIDDAMELVRRDLYTLNV